MLTTKEFRFKKIIIIFLNKGEKVRFRNDNLIVEDSEGKVKHQSTCYRLFAVYIVGSYTLTSGIIQRAKKFGFTIILMTYSFRIYEVLSCEAKGNTMLRVKQYKYEKINIAKHLVENKINNQIRVLKKSRQPGELAREVIARMGTYLEKSKNAVDEASLLGLEGSAAKAYFQQIYIEFDWKGRKPRVKHDINNCLLDIGYTFLFTFVESILNCYGFDLYKGFYHKLYYQRKSLVCDLVEPFRCIVDYQIRKMNNLNMIDVDDFIVIDNRYHPKYKKSSKYTGVILKSILDYKNEIFVYVQQFYRSFMRDRNINGYPVFEYS